MIQHHLGLQGKTPYPAMTLNDALPTLRRQLMALGMGDRMPLMEAEGGADEGMPQAYTNEEAIYLPRALAVGEDPAENQMAYLYLALHESYHHLLGSFSRVLEGAAGEALGRVIERGRPTRRQHLTQMRETLAFTELNTLLRYPAVRLAFSLALPHRFRFLNNLVEDAFIENQLALRFPGLSDTMTRVQKMSELPANTWRNLGQKEQSIVALCRLVFPYGLHRKQWVSSDLFRLLSQSQAMLKQALLYDLSSSERLYIALALYRIWEPFWLENPDETSTSVAVWKTEAKRAAAKENVANHPSPKGHCRGAEAVPGKPDPWWRKGPIRTHEHYPLGVPHIPVPGRVTEYNSLYQRVEAGAVDVEPLAKMPEFKAIEAMGKQWQLQATGSVFDSHRLHRFIVDHAIGLATAPNIFRRRTFVPDSPRLRIVLIDGTSSMLKPRSNGMVPLVLAKQWMEALGPGQPGDHMYMVHDQSRSNLTFKAFGWPQGRHSDVWRSLERQIKMGGFRYGVAFRYLAALLQEREIRAEIMILTDDGCSYLNHLQDRDRYGKAVKRLNAEACGTCTHQYTCSMDSIEGDANNIRGHVASPVYLPLEYDLADLCHARSEYPEQSVRLIMIGGLKQKPSVMSLMASEVETHWIADELDAQRVAYHMTSNH